MDNVCGPVSVGNGSYSGTELIERIRQSDARNDEHREEKHERLPVRSKGADKERDERKK